MPAPNADPLVERAQPLGRKRPHRRAGRAPVPIYLGALAIATVVPTLLLLAYALRAGVSLEVLAVLAVPLALAASQLAVGVVNWLATLLLTFIQRF